MLNNCFYKYKDKEFIFATDLNKINPDSNKIIILKSLDDANSYNKLQNYPLGVMSNNPNVISFWINKKIDYIINPFDFRGKGFDNNVFSIMKQNKILPIILLGKIFLDDKEKQIQIFKHLITFNKLCKKYKMPIIILHNDIDITNVTYRLLGYNEIQAKRFVGEFNEKEN